MRAGRFGVVSVLASFFVAAGNSARADYAEDVLADNPIAYWRLGDEVGSFTVADAGRSSIAGSYVGFPELEEDGLIADDDDTAVRFNGFDAEVQIPDHALINTGGPYSARSIEVWFVAEETAPGTMGMLYEEGGATRGLNMYVENVDGAAQLFMTAWNLAEEAWGSIVVQAEIEFGEVYHAVLILDASANESFGDFDGRLTGYLNGDEIGTETGADRLYAHGDNIAIGGIDNNTLLPDGFNPGDGSNFSGVIDDVALYAYALDDPDNDEDRSDSRVVAHYIAGTNLVSPCFTADTTEGTAPLTVNLDAGCTTSKVAIESLRWEFSDGETAEGQTVTHEFATVGPHGVTLTVEISSGLTLSTHQAISVICDVPEFDESDIGEATSPGGGCATAECVDIWGSSDGFSATGDAVYFVHQQTTGDVTIRAQIRDRTLDGSAFAGIMLRAGLDADSAFVALGVRSSTMLAIALNRLEKAERVNSRANRFEVASPNVFLELQRRGAEVVASASTDGVQFTELRTLPFEALGPTLFAGITIDAARSEAEVSRAVFCNIEIESGPGGSSGFRRGDCNADGLLGVADPIANLAHQFLGETATCLDACDFDDSGVIELSDPISNLAHQFLGADAPAPPGVASCGPDPSEDELGCALFAACP